MNDFPHRPKTLLFHGWCVLATVTGIVAGPNPAEWTNDLRPITSAEWNYSRAAHLLERAGFGGTPGEVQKLAAMTPADAVDYLVDYQKIEDGDLPRFEPSGIYPHGHKLIPLDEAVQEVFRTGKAYGILPVQEGALSFQPAVNEFYTLLISEHAEMRRAAQWWAERMLLTPRPLQEKLTLFWHDHFATSQEKVLNHELMLLQIQTLRERANGSFRDLLVAMAQDPAMLIWLDNRENVKGKPNENFAREVMELFCMGEGQGYTESDIREMARAFTGWTLRPIKTTRDGPEFIDDPKLHDAGEKSMLGATGNFTGRDAIELILKQPATPRHISRKLYRHFVREEISPEVNQRLATALLESRYELKPLLKMIFLSRDFYSEATVGTQVKPPVDFLISTYRKLGLRKLPGVPEFSETASTLGQMLFYPPNVAGWPGGKSWINPATLLSRGNFAHALLFPESAPAIAPDKIIAEGYRNIPQMFPQYDLQPRIWSADTGRMEPVSMDRYRQYLAALEEGSMKGPGATPRVEMNDSRMGRTPVENEPKSKMAEIADSEWYNLAVGVYTGFVEAYNRVKPIPALRAEIDTVQLARDSKAATVGELVDYLARRFLSVDLSPERRAVMVAFLKDELASDRVDPGAARLPTALRLAVHLVLSAPEYQLD